MVDSEQAGHSVGVLGITQPDAILQASRPRRGREAHFRSQLTALLAVTVPRSSAVRHIEKS